MIPIKIYDPSDLNGAEPPPLEQYGWRFLAEGDSWFTIGSLNPVKNSSLLFTLAFRQSHCVVSCAYPGDTLQHMVDMVKGRDFSNLLRGRQARYWDAILLSAGGNDLIDAVGARGPGLAPAKRLLLDTGEWGPAALGAARYVSEPGWQTFSGYFRTNLRALVQLRDAGPSVGVPIFLHGYAVPTPRPAGAGLGFGPWLYPALRAYGIPEADYVALATELIGRLRSLIASCAADSVQFPRLYYLDTSGLPIQPAGLGTAGQDGDWVNEIHLTRRGYEKATRAWAAQIEDVLGR